MSLKTVANVITRTASRQMLRAQKNSPTLLFGAGVVGIVATVVLASRATLKLDEVLDDADYDLGKIKAAELSSKYTEADRRADVIKVYVRSGAKIVVLYAPAAIIGMASIAALTGSHIVLNRRNVSLTAAYAGLDKAYRAYRERVIKTYGADADVKLRYDTEEYEYVEETAQGPVVKRGQKILKNVGDPYSVCFDPTNRNWQPEPWQNQFFLQSIQNYCNEKLRAQGHLFLNEAFDMLGMPHTSAGAVCGWVLGTGHDDYVTFGIFDNDMEAGTLFAMGLENSVWLNLNCDGVIYDKI